jgi:hypothetical protein
MGGLYASGRIVDLIVLLVVIEAIALLAWGRRSAGGPDAATVILALLPGALLLLALRAALTSAPWPQTALWLAASGLAHAADLRRRLSRH